MSDNIRSGMLVLINHSILCEVTNTDERGWSFYCVNGAWSGYFNVVDNIVKIDGRNEDNFSATVTSTAQPPDSVYHYNEIIPWMQERPL